jgi:hypothetical protein
MGSFASGSLDTMDRDQKLFPGQQDILLAQQLSAAGVLMNLGMGKSQLDDLARSRKLTQEIIINTPATKLCMSTSVNWSGHTGFFCPHYA